MKFKNKRTFKNRILAMMLAIAMLCTGINVTAFANEGTKASSSASATVYLSASADEVYIGNTENIDKPVVLQKLTVPYFDLALYGLEKFYFSSEDYGMSGVQPGTEETAEGKVTMLHALIYATEVLYCGVDESDAGKGYLKEQNLLGTDTLSIDGKAGSMWMQKFWGMNENLNYYKNYEYPLAGPGWGATADQVLVHDGDVISFAHFSDMSFYSDLASGFHYLKANGQMTQVEVTKGVDKDLSLEVYRTAQSQNGDYSTLQNKITDENALFYTSVDDLDDGRVSAWKELGITDTDGNLTVDVDSLPAGEYLIGIDGQPGVNTDAICSAPGAIRLTVKGPDEKDTAAAKEVTEKISAIGDVTLESEDAIKEARTAYDALTDAQKELVSNKDVLEKAETTLKELKDAKDADDAKVAATPKSITLSNTRYIYNGKVQKPKVTVKNAKGEVIKGYTVKYAGNCKNVGKYKVTLTFKGDYNGTKTKTFKIAPKSVTVKSLKAAKKSFAVKWSKQTTQVTGYQVQYSTDKNFVKAVKDKKITKNSVVTKTVKNLKSKKVYYVRVRTYKTVKYNGEQMNLHSDWSKVKKVTVK